MPENAIQAAMTNNVTYVAGGASVAQGVADSALDEKIYVFGEHLATHGMFLLSWSEIISINLALFVTYRLVHGIYSLFKELRSDFNG